MDYNESYTDVSKENRHVNLEMKKDILEILKQP